MEERFRVLEDRLALLEGRINSLENGNVSLLGLVNQQAVVHSFDRHQFTQLMQQDALIWAPFFIKITCGEVLMEELLASKPNKNRDRPNTAWYSVRKIEDHVISMAARMGLQVEDFVTLADALIEERNLTAHFSFGERGRRVSDLSLPIPQVSTAEESASSPGKYN